MEWQQEDRPEVLADNASPRRRGRPPGSVSLTPEIEQTIVANTRAGAFASAAAEAAGISVRTFHEWMARGEDRHPSRPSTPKLRAFANAVRRAHAEARVAAETRVHKERPAYWLTHAARSTTEEEGWTMPPEAEGEQAPPAVLSMEERLAKFSQDAEFDGRCPDPACPCSLHTRGPDGTRRPYDYSD